MIGKYEKEEVRFQDINHYRSSKKMKEYSNDLDELVIKHFLKDDTEREIAQKILMSCNTVHSTISKYKSTKCVVNMWETERKRKTTTNIDRIIQRRIKVDRRKSALSVKSELKSELGLTISESTMSRKLYEVGFNGRVAHKIPLRE